MNTNALKVGDPVALIRADGGTYRRLRGPTRAVVTQVTTGRVYAATAADRQGYAFARSSGRVCGDGARPYSRLEPWTEAHDLQVAAINELGRVDTLRHDLANRVDWSRLTGFQADRIAALLRIFGVLK